MSKKIVFYIATFILSLVFATAAQAEEIDGVDYEVSKPLQSDLQLVQSSPVTFATLSYKNGFFDNHADAYTVSGGDKASTAVNNKLGENSTGAFSFANRATLTINLNDYYDFDGFFIEFASARGLSGESEITSTISDRLIVQFYLDNKVVQTIETDKLIGNTRYSSKNYSLSNTTKANKVTVKSENSAILYTFIREIELYEPEKIYLAVTDLKVSNITTDSAVVSWTIPTDEDIKNVKLNGDDVGLVTSKKIEGLKSETSYTATVETVYKDGTTIKAVINYKTLATPKPPSDVSSLSATKTHEQVKLSWSSTEKEEDVEYVIYRKKKSASPFLANTCDGSQHGAEALDFGQRLGHIAFARGVRQDDQSGLGGAFAAPFIGFALQHGVDADARTRQQAGDLGQHARFVRHANAQVVAGDHIGHRQHGQFVASSSQGAALEGQCGHAVRGVRAIHAGNVHQIGNQRSAQSLRPYRSTASRPRHRHVPPRRSWRLPRWRSGAWRESAQGARAAQCPCPYAWRCPAA